VGIWFETEVERGQFMTGSRERSGQTGQPDRKYRIGVALTVGRDQQNFHHTSNEVNKRLTRSAITGGN
jgi:hypothetical protein